MRITRYIAMAAMAASVLLSCTKVEGDNTSGTTENPQERIITISYAGTRTAVDGLAVTFKVGDEIKLYNGSASQVVKVSEASNGTQFLSTTLTGNLEAVYPAKYAVVNGNSLTYGVPPVQTGRFEDADICMATGITDNADFTTQVSILRFYVDESIGVTSISVEGSDIANDVSNGNLVPADYVDEINVNLQDVNFTSLADQTDDPDERICYVAIKPGTYSAGLTFSSVTLTQDEWENNTVTRSVPNAILTNNYIYNAFIPYYIKLDLGEGIIQRWGYCNIGAFLPEEVGLYFAWGDTVGYKPDDHDFSASNAPYLDYHDDELDKDFYKKYNETDGLSVLESEDDAANKHWGDNWRMPSYEDLKTLLNGEQFITTYYHNSSSPYYELSFDDASLCFPKSGNIDDDFSGLDYDETDYWLSTVDEADPSFSWYFSFEKDADFDDKGILTLGSDQTYFRSLGYNIRPIWGEASEPDEPDTDITGSLDPLGPIGKSVL